MTFSRAALSLVASLLLLLGGCATRQGNPAIAQYAPRGHQFEGLESRGNRQDFVILAFSGGGTRAAALSYGVLEALRRIEIVTNSGRNIRLLDEVDLITGVSGGSFTGLAYGLYS